MLPMPCSVRKLLVRGDPFQILDGRPPAVARALLRLDVVLISMSRLTFPARCFGLAGEGLARPAIRGVRASSRVGAQGFEPGEPLLVPALWRKCLFPRLIAYPSRSTGKPSSTEDVGIAGRWRLCCL